MNLASILLVAIAILTVLTGLVALTGASRVDRGRMAWFFVATLGSMIWSLSVGFFLGAPSTISDGLIKVITYGIYLSPLVAVPALLGYSAWKYTAGKVVTVVYILLAAVLGTLLVSSPDLWMADLRLSEALGNSVTIVDGWFYMAYGLYFATCFTLYLGILFYRAKHTRNKRIRSGDMLLVIGMMISSGLVGTFDLILPYFGNYSLIWVGPIAVAAVMIIFFYAIIRYRIVSVEARWMRVMSYIVVIASGVIVYMVLFYIVFTALFKIPNPSTSILVLNFLMIVIVLLLIPVINEVTASIRSLISVGQVDLAYVIKKLNRIATKNVDLRDLAGFLADHLHFAYIGFIINGKLYGSKALMMSQDELSQIIHIKTNTKGVWQEPNKSVQKILDGLDLKAVAELRTAKGKVFGQLLVGKPLGKSSFERRDLIQLEMIINLVATVIDSEKHLRA